MKTSARLVALGVVSLGFSVGMLGCADSNDKNSMVNSEGKSVPGEAAPGTPTSSAGFADKAKTEDPTKRPDYPK